MLPLQVRISLIKSHIKIGKFLELLPIRGLLIEIITLPWKFMLYKYNFCINNGVHFKFKYGFPSKISYYKIK